MTETKLVRSAANGLALVANYIFWDGVSDAEIDSALDIFSKTTQYLKLAKLPTTGFITTTSELLILNCVSEEAVKQLQSDILAIRKQITNSDTSAEILEILKNISSVCGGNEKAYALLNTKLHILTNEFVKQSFTDKISSSDIKTVVRNFVRTRGSALVDYSDMLKYLNTMGIEHKYPDTFIGFIDEAGIFYTSAKKRIEGIPLNSTLVMNKNYDPKADSSYVFSARAENAKSTTYFYTREYKLRSRKEKFTAVKQLGIDIKGIRGKWSRIIKTRSEGYEEAIILELIYQTQARIGSSSNMTLDKRTGKYLKTYGITTVRAKHLTVDGGVINFKYPGKGAFKGDVIHYQNHVITSEDPILAIVIKDLTARINKLSADDEVFSTSAPKVRELFKNLGASDYVNVHKLRTLKGTMMMTERIKNHPFKGKRVSSTSITKWLREEALEVGKQLGHMSGEKYTAATALAHYIDPQIMTRLFKELDCVIPKTLAKLSGEVD
jgi:DNA topoisomerase IB